MKDGIIVLLVVAIVGVGVWKWKDIKGWFTSPKKTEDEKPKEVDCATSPAFRYIFDLTTVKKQRKIGEPERSTASAVDAIKNIFDYSIAKKDAANGKWEGLKGDKISFVAKKNVAVILDGGFNAVGLKYEKICLLEF